jgi:hypothetical protein
MRQERLRYLRPLRSADLRGEAEDPNLDQSCKRHSPEPHRWLQQWVSSMPNRATDLR